MSLAQGLLDRVTALAAEHGARRVLRVRVRIGPQAGIVTESFRFGFDVLKGASPVTGAAVLELEGEAAAKKVSPVPADRGADSLWHGEQVVPGCPGTGAGDGNLDGADIAIPVAFAAALYPGFAALTGGASGADDLLLMQVELETDKDDEIEGK
jgi:hydrogenase nickel incorporation protein HypA/HybF